MLFMRGMVAFTPKTGAFKKKLQELVENVKSPRTEADGAYERRGYDCAYSGRGEVEVVRETDGRLRDIYTAATGAPSAMTIVTGGSRQKKREKRDERDRTGGLVIHGRREEEQQWVSRQRNRRAVDRVPSSDGQATLYSMEGPERARQADYSATDSRTAETGNAADNGPVHNTDDRPMSRRMEHGRSRVVADKHSALALSLDTPEGLEDEHAGYMDVLGRLAPYMESLKANYVTVHRAYSSVRTFYNENVEAVARLNKRVNSQVERINGMAEQLDGLQHENTQLRDRECTFLLYKKEVGKYIEIFKSNLDNKTAEIEALYEQNNQNKRRNIQLEYETDILMRNDQDRNILIKNILREKELIDQEIGGIRDRMRIAEGQLRQWRERVCRELQEGCTVKNVLYRKTFDLVRAEVEDVRAIGSRMTEQVGKLRIIMREHEQEGSRQREYIGDLKRALESAQIRHEMREASLTEQLNEKDREIDRIRDEADGNESRLKALMREMVGGLLRRVESGILTRLGGVLASLIGLECRMRGYSNNDMIERVKRHYAAVTARQKGIFETLQAEYRRRIEGLCGGRCAHGGDSGPTSESDESDIWDVFK